MPAPKRPKPPDTFSLTGTAELDLQASADGESPKQPTFKIKAYNGGAMQVRGFYRPVAIDLRNIQANSQVPILLDHDPTQIVGQSSEVTVNAAGVTLSGIVTGEDEPSQKVIMHAKNGFVWAASVGVSIAKLEQVGEGVVVKVNGRSLTGPLFVVRAGRLDEVSFVAIGADRNTSASVTADAAHDKEVISMTFEQWLEANGFAVEEITEEQQKTLQAAYDAEQGAEKTESPESGMETVEAARDGGSDTDVAGDTGDVVTQTNLKAAANVRRINAIREKCGGTHSDIEAKAIEEGWTVDATELAVLRADRPKINNLQRGSSNITANALEASLCMASGMSEEDAGEVFDERTMNAAHSADLRGAGLHMLLYETIRAAGGYARPGRVDNSVIRAAFEADQRIVQASGGFSTISLSGILSNVANKTMLAAYKAVESTLDKWCAFTDVSDFKAVTRYRMTGIGQFTEVGPNGELKHITLSEESYTNQALTYGEMLVLTRTMMIDDDLGAFMQIPRIIGRGAIIALVKLVFSRLLSNPSGFFHADNGNLLEGTDTALSIAALNVAEQKFLDQKDANGDPILISPAVLLVPTSLKVTAQQLMTETRVNETTTANKPKVANNPHAGKWEPVSSPYLNAQSLTGSSSTAWYLLADPADVAAIEVAFLRGKRVPTIESGETNFNTLGMGWRGFFDFGVAMQDHRAAVKCTGEAAA